VLRFVARGSQADSAVAYADFMVLDEAGNILLTAEDMRATHSKALNRLAPAAAKLVSRTA
jgi:hypothetical protein